VVVGGDHTSEGSNRLGTARDFAVARFYG
jgi:hypothetical protein